MKIACRDIFKVLSILVKTSSIYVPRQPSKAALWREI